MQTRGSASTLFEPCHFAESFHSQYIVLYLRCHHITPIAPVVRTERSSKFWSPSEKSPSVPVHFPTQTSPPQSEWGGGGGGPGRLPPPPPFPARSIYSKTQAHFIARLSTHRKVLKNAVSVDIELSAWLARMMRMQQKKQSQQMRRTGSLR